MIYKREKMSEILHSISIVFAISFLEGDRIVLLSTDGNGKTYFVTINTSRLCQ